jgi:hypothetical protein
VRLRAAGRDFTIHRMIRSVKTKRIAIYFSVLFVFVGGVQSSVSQEAPAGEATPMPNRCATACVNRQTACLKACEVALSSAVMSKVEYQACMDHCVADYISCKAGC